MFLAFSAFNTLSFARLGFAALRFAITCYLTALHRLIDTRLAMHSYVVFRSLQASDYVYFSPANQLLPPILLDIMSTVVDNAFLSHCDSVTTGTTMMLDQPYQVNNNRITRDCSAACFKDTLPDQLRERPSMDRTIAKNTRKNRPMTQERFELERDEQAVRDAENVRRAIKKDEEQERREKATPPKQRDFSDPVDPTRKEKRKRGIETV